MGNHLIIGLGGTGGSVIRELRKTIHRRNGGKVSPDWVNIKYLYVDSSPKELANQSSWKSLGQSIELDQHSKLSIQGIDLPKLVEGLDKRPGLKGWVGDRNLWKPYLENSHGADAAGGQRRRLGRILFAANVGAFNAAVSDQVSSLEGGAGGRAGAAGATFHIVCGLAGGTGSGSVIDTVCQIRKRWPTRQYPIIVYALLPEENADKARTVSGYYQANGYAALLELNALSAGRFSPYDVSSYRVERHELRNRFNGCYLIGNRTESKAGAESIVYKVEDMPGVIADFLFQKIVAVHNLDHWTELPRWENGENANPLPETSRRIEQNPLDADDQGSGDRSRRFMTFGIKRIVIPETEIREYLAYGFARAAALQLKANNWTDFGYIELPRNVDFTWVTHKDTQNRWRLSNDHLLLSVPILDSDQAAKWKPIEQDWEGFINNTAQDLQTVASDRRQLALEELEKRCNNRFDNDFRKLGVVRFYQEKFARRRNEAREITRIIEKELLERWLTGDLSLTEIAGGKVEDREIKGVIQELREDVALRGDKVDRSIVSLREVENKQAAVISENKKTWSKMGMVAGWMGKGPKLLQAQIDANRSLYITRTKIAAWNFAKVLLASVAEELTLLGSEASKASTTLSNSLASFQQELEQRCNDSPQLDFKKQVVKFYNPTDVHTVAELLAKDRPTQERQTAEVRRAILGRIAAQVPTFAFFNRDISEQVLQEIGLTTALEQSRIAHDALELSESKQLLGVNIVDRIRTLYPTEERLRQFAREIIPKASCFGPIDDSQRLDHQANPAPESICRRIISILGPNFGDDVRNAEAPANAFVAQLKNSFKGATEAGDISCVFVDTGVASRHEICLVSLTNLVPARCLTSSAFLRTEYNDLLGRQGDHTQDRLFLHIEGDGTQYPSIYTRERKEIEEDARAVLLQAKAAGLLVERTNNVTGNKSLAFDLHKDGVLQERREIGVSLLDIPRNIDYIDLEDLEILVSAERSKLVHQEAKQQFKEKLQAELAAIQALCKNEPSHPEYRAYVAGYNRAVAQLTAQA